MDKCGISISKCNSFDKDSDLSVHIEIIDENRVIVFSGYMTHEEYGRLIIGRGYSRIEREL